MKNTPVGQFEAEDIKKQVEKVLKGLGNPEPPLDLRDVRELLKLDVKYYSSKNDDFLHETISRLKIAGKQIVARPSLLIDVVKKAKLSALWIPDHKRILIDESTPKLKHRWMEGHEVGHSITPWHQRYLFGDDSESLKQSCHEKLENEANFASGQLLFLLDRFSNEANDMPKTLDTVRKLKKTFGNTNTCTLWRFVEEAHPDTPMVGVVSQHPKRKNGDFDPSSPCKYIIESGLFKEKFSSTSSIELFKIIENHSSWAKGGPLGESEAVLIDLNGNKHLFKFETFSNTYEALTLGVYIRPIESSILTI